MENSWNNREMHNKLIKTKSQRLKRQPTNSLQRSAYRHQHYVNTIYVYRYPMQTKTSSHGDSNGSTSADFNYIKNMEDNNKNPTEWNGLISLVHNNYNKPFLACPVRPRFCCKLLLYFHSIRLWQSLEWMMIYHSCGIICNPKLPHLWGTFLLVWVLAQFNNKIMVWEFGKPSQIDYLLFQGER